MDWSLLLFALMMIESGGKDIVIGDGGKSYGCLQIQQCVIDDVNRIYGANFVHREAFDKQKALKIAMLYLSYQAKRYEKSTGKPADFQILARIWNGGPFGYRKPATLPYWFKVKKQIALLRAQKK